MTDTSENNQKTRVTAYNVNEISKLGDILFVDGNGNKYSESYSVYIRLINQWVLFADSANHHNLYYFSINDPWDEQCSYMLLRNESVDD